MATPDQVLANYLSGTQPHHRAIQITAQYILPARARRLKGSQIVLGEIAAVISEYARHLAKEREIDWGKLLHVSGADKPSRGRFDEPEFEASGFICRVSARQNLSAGVQLRKFTLYDPSREREGDKPIATLEALEHLSSLWEVVDVEVVSSYRRRGVARVLYDATERYNCASLFAPSGWLTGDGLAFWSAREPGVSSHFARHPECKDLFVSAKQLIFVRDAFAWKALQDWDGEGVVH